MSLCRKQQPRGVWRCDLDRDHRGNHKVHDAEGNVIEEWENDRERRHATAVARNSARRSNTKVNPLSDGEAESQSYWCAITDTKLRRQEAACRAASEPVAFYCEANVSSACPGKIETTFEEARKYFTGHHNDERQSQGRGFKLKDREPGRDDPAGHLLTCPPCHRILDARVTIGDEGFRR